MVRYIFHPILVTQKLWTIFIDVLIQLFNLLSTEANDNTSESFHMLN